MYFQKAIGYLKNGECLRRECWKKNLYIRLNAETNLINSYEIGDYPDGFRILCVDEQFRYEDVVANDWKIFEGTT